MLTEVVFIKMLGAVCVVSGCIGMGLSVSGGYRRRCKSLEMLRQMMVLLRSEIRYARSELPEAFENVAPRVAEPFSEFLRQLAAEMREMTGQSFLTLWEKHMDRDLSFSGLTEGDRAQLQKLGGQLGFLDQEMQLAAIDLYMEGLNGVIAACSESMPKKQKLSLSLGILSGLFLSILLV